MPATVSRFLDLSTSHIPDDQWVDPDFGEMRSSEHEYGFTVYLSHAVDYEAGETADVPDWFRPIWDLAIKNECSMVNFDRDAQVVDDLPTFSDHG